MSALDELAAGLPYARMLTRAGAAIVVCTEPDRAFERSRDMAIIDASLAGENILLAVEALGLGGVWTAAYPYADRMKHVCKVLKIPEDVIPLNVIAIGHDGEVSTAISGGTVLRGGSRLITIGSTAGRRAFQEEFGG